VENNTIIYLIHLSFHLTENITATQHRNKMITPTENRTATQHRNKTIRPIENRSNNEQKIKRNSGWIITKKYL
jgi:hypothetical protein